MPSRQYCGSRLIAIALIAGAAALPLSGCTHPSLSNAGKSAEGIALFPFYAPIGLVAGGSINPISDAPPITYSWDAKVSSDGNEVALFKEGKLFIYKIDERQMSNVPLSNYGGVGYAAFSPDGRYLALITPCNTVCGNYARYSKVVIVGLVTNRVEQEFQLPTAVTAHEILFSPDGTRIALLTYCKTNCPAGSQGSRVAILDSTTSDSTKAQVLANLRYVQDDTTLRTDLTYSSRSALHFSADGKSILYSIFEMFGGRNPGTNSQIAIAQLDSVEGPREHILQGDPLHIPTPEGFAANGDALFLAGQPTLPMHHYAISHAGRIMAARVYDTFDRLDTDFVLCAADCSKAVFISRQGRKLFALEGDSVRQVTNVDSLRVLDFARGGKSAVAIADNVPTVIDIATGALITIPEFDFDKSPGGKTPAPVSRNRPPSAGPTMR